MLKRFLYSSILHVFLAIGVFAQNVDIKGKVTNREGLPVAGASVVLKNLNKSATTDQAGLYQISGTSDIGNVQHAGSLYSVAMTNNSICLFLKAPGQITVSLFTVYGRSVAMLHNGSLNKGRHRFAFPSRSLSRQVYLLRIGTGSQTGNYTIIPINNSFTLSNRNVHPATGAAIAKGLPVNDTLSVTCTGYEAKTVPVTEYIATINIRLEFDWSDFLYPEIIFQNKYTSFSKFITRFPSIEDTAKTISYGVCRKLYRKFSESLKLEKITFILDSDPNTIGWKAGKPPAITICIGGPYLEKYMNSNGLEKMADEVKGIMWHEYTHGYQYDDGNSNGIIGIIEGVGDCVRYLAGYIDISQRRPGGNWDSGYKTSAFFFAWLQEEYNGGNPEFLYLLNQSMDIDDGITWSKEAFKTITGETVEELWKKYQDDITK